MFRSWIELDNPAFSRVNHATLILSCINRVLVSSPRPYVSLLNMRAGVVGDPFDMKEQDF